MVIIMSVLSLNHWMDLIDYCDIVGQLALLLGVTLVFSGKGSYFQVDWGEKFCYSAKQEASTRTGKALVLSMTMQGFVLRCCWTTILSSTHLNHLLLELIWIMEKATKI